MLLRTASCTLACALFALLLLWYFIIYGSGMVSALLEKKGRACDPFSVVERHYLTTSVSVVRSLHQNAMSCFMYLNVLDFISVV